MKRSEPSFEALYRRHAGGAFRRAQRILGNAADAHEIVHDVFLSLFERPEQYAGRSAFTTFLYSAITHACLNHLRNQNNRTRLLQEHGSVLWMEPGARAEAEHSAELRGLLLRMPEQLAQVAVYRHFDSLSHRDIARVVGCSIRQVVELLTRLETWVQQPEPAICPS